MKFPTLAIVLFASALTVLASPISPAGSSLEMAAEVEARGICTCLCDPCSGRCRSCGPP